MRRQTVQQNSAKETKPKNLRIRYFRNEQNIGAALNFTRVFELSTRRCSMLVPATIFTHLNSWSVASTRLTEIRVHSSHTRTIMMDDRGQPLLFDQERNCYLDQHGQYLMTPVPSHVARAASPEMRFREVLWEMGWAMPLSGVIRREALLRTSGYGNYLAPTKLFWQSWLS